MSAPLLVMLAGPNGAGKSTFFEANLRDNSSFASPHRLLAEFRRGEVFRRGEGEVPGWATRFLG